MVLVDIIGSFGSGKSSLVKLLSKDLDAVPYLEDPNKVPMLKQYYAGGKESRKQLAFALQIAWLDIRYTQLKQAIHDDWAVMDSNLMADSCVYKTIYQRGETTEAEYNVYLGLLKHMLDNVAGDPTGAYPDLYVYLDISPENEIKAILGRGRKMETADPKLIEYYYSINKGFSDWYKGYSQSPVLRINRNDVDFVNNKKDAIKVLNKIENKLVDLGKLSDKEFDEIKKRRK